jgi:hypothetical protein
MSDRDHNDPLEHQQGKYDRGPVLTSNFQLNKNPIYFGPGQVFDPEVIEYVEPPITAWRDKDALVIPRVFRFIYAAKGEYDTDDYNISSSSPPPPPPPPPPEGPGERTCTWVVHRIDVFFMVCLNQHWTQDENSIWEWVYPTPVPDRTPEGTPILRGSVGYWGYGPNGGKVMNSQISTQNTNIRIITQNGLGSEVYNGSIFTAMGGFLEAEGKRFVYMVHRCRYGEGEPFDSSPVLIGGNTIGMGSDVGAMIAAANTPTLLPGENPPP